MRTGNRSRCMPKGDSSTKSFKKPCKKVVKPSRLKEVALNAVDKKGAVSDWPEPPWALAVSFKLVVAEFSSLCRQTLLLLRVRMNVCNRCSVPCRYCCRPAPWPVSRAHSFDARRHP